MAHNTTAATVIGALGMRADEGLDSASTASASSRRAPSYGTSVSGPVVEILSRWENQTTVSSCMAYPSFLEIGDLIIARIRRPHFTPSSRFSFSSTKRCKGQCSAAANRATQHNDGMSLLAMSRISNQATATAALPPKAEFRAAASAFQSYPSASPQGADLPGHAPVGLVLTPSRPFRYCAPKAYSAERFPEPR